MGTQRIKLADYLEPMATPVGASDEPMRQGPPGSPLTPGNIDLYGQPKVKNPNGSISTVDSFSVDVDGSGREVLLSQITAEGKRVTPQEAEAAYRKTGKHLGIFPDVPSANAYAEQLHKDYEAGKYDTRPMPKGLGIGAKVTLKNGRQGTVTKINPDGTFEYK